MINKIFSNSRSGFSMITAIFIIVLMSGVAALIFNLTGRTLKETTSQYRKEQAILLARSYTEFAIMAASARDVNTTGTSCLEDISANIGTDDDINKGEGYKIQTNLYYIGDGYRYTTDANSNCSNTRILYRENLYKDENSTLNIIVDVYVKYRDMELVEAFIINGNTPTATNLPWVTYHKRTLQKI